MIFSGFDDGGWWLVVLGCRGGRRPPGLAEKLARKHPNSSWAGWPCEREKGERKWVFGLSCVFLTNPTLG